MQSQAVRNVVIAGGSGFIGKALEYVFKLSGANVWRLTRTPKSKFEFDWKQLERNGLPEQTEIVINACGQNILDKRQRWSDQLRQQLFDSRIQTSRSLANSLVQLVKSKPTLQPKFPVYIGFSGVSIYSDQTLIPHDEFSTDFSNSIWADLCLRLEQAAFEPLNQIDPSIRCILLRTGVVLGKSGGMIKDLYLPFKFGLGARIGSGRQPFPWIHLYDLAELVMFLAEQPEANGVFNAVAPELATNRDFTKEFASALNRPAPFVIPKCLMRIMFGQERAQLILRSPYVIPFKVQSLNFPYEYPTMKLACAKLAS